MNLFSLRIVAVFFLLFQTSLLVHASDNSVPVSITYRRAMSDKSAYAARFENTSDKSIMLTIVMERGNGKSKKTFPLALKPHQTKEIGLHQGWKSFSGDRVTISSEGFAAFSDEVP